MREELLLQVEDVRRSFDQGRITALNGVSAAVGRGERLAVVGRSGSGKSCLLNMMAGLDVPTSGRVLWQDQPVISRRHWAAIRQQSIGIVFQEFHLLPTLTAQQNVELALMPGDLSQTEQTRRAAAMLDRVGLRERRGQLPSQLSGGERQRVAIARALVRDPLLLLADEPTGNLDTANAETVATLLFDLQSEHQMTLVLVTHDEGFAARCERCIRLADGRIVDGLPATAEATA
ncbi:MAG TPA: ABC transporter ATP-binding protein [Aestuariivirga sp.]|nr:ABC transporter ATP-binding protein [Aestuariivirga sp.]